MKKYLALIMPHIGLASVYLGALLLVVSFLLGWTTSRAVLLFSLFLIIVGVVVHVVIMKRSHKY